MTARHLIAYAIILAAIVLLVAWRLAASRSNKRARVSRNERIDLFGEAP